MALLASAGLERHLRKNTPRPHPLNPCLIPLSELLCLRFCPHYFPPREQGQSIGVIITEGKG